LIKESTESLENYSIDIALNKLMDFVINDFSRTYIKMTRDREDTRDIIGEVMEKVSLLLAPYAPYISEMIYQDFHKGKSVHLSSWPKYENRKINKKLEEEFKIIMQIIERGLYERDKAQIGLKWPLAKAIVNVNKKLDKNLLELAKNQLNLKDIRLKIEKKEGVSVELDTQMNLELETEGYAREISRKVQDCRKKAGFVKQDKIELAIKIEGNIDELILKTYPQNYDFIKERVNAKKLEIGNAIDDKNYENKYEDKIKGKAITILFNRI
jgi:isoleucyl-tRNA synthetase